MRKSIILKLMIYIFLGLVSFFFLSACEAEEPENQPQVIDDQKDGRYTGYSDSSDDGGYAWAKVSIKNQKIIDVELMEITEKGNEKDYDTYKYEPAVKAYEEMPERFVKANSAEIDVYSGATHSSKMFISAVERALDYASGGEEGTFYDGQFQGESRRTDYGYAVALVNIRDDRIRDIELKEVNAEGNWKDYDEYDWEAAGEASEEMAERFVEANSTEVDLYTNATQSSIRFQEAVENAMRHARQDPDYNPE